MGNVWGIANPTGVPAVFPPPSDIACPAGTLTAVLATPNYTAAAPGNYYPIVWGNLLVLCGATPPTALLMALSLNGGATVDQLLIAPSLLVANALLNLPVAMVGANSPTAWAGAGSTVWISFNPTGQAITFKQAGSRLLVALFRGPDG